MISLAGHRIHKTLHRMRDYFLCYVKGIASATEPTTPDNMQNRIHNAMGLIPEEMLRRTTLSLQHRLYMCLAPVGEDVFEHLL